MGIGVDGVGQEGVLDAGWAPCGKHHFAEGFGSRYGVDVGGFRPFGFAQGDIGLGMGMAWLITLEASRTRGFGPVAKGVWG